MKRKALSFCFLACLLVLLCSCFTNPKPVKYLGSTLAIGMSQDEVITKWGEPADITKVVMENVVVETWIYREKEELGAFRSAVADWIMQEKYGARYVPSYWYTILVFRNGKLMSWQESKD